MPKKFMPIARQEEIVVQELENETLVYDLLRNRGICLNQTSSLVWQNCNGKNTAAEISDILTVKFKEFVSEELVSLALRQLSKENLLQNESVNIEEISRTSRREVIKKIGLTSAIALPLISSIIAPKAIQAQSGAPTCMSPTNRPEMCPCSSSTQCAGGCCQDPGGGRPLTCLAGGGPACVP